MKGELTMNFERFLDRQHKVHYVDIDKISKIVVDTGNWILYIDDEVVPCRDYFHMENILEILSGSYGYGILYKWNLIISNFGDIFFYMNYRNINGVGGDFL